MQNSLIDRIFDYDNYRFFLRDFFAEQKRIKAVFSHRFFARRAGFASCSFSAHVIEGKRNLTQQSLSRMVKGLGLNSRAASYFETLVLYNQAQSPEERERYFKQLEKIRKGTQFYRVNQQQHAYYDEWYYPVIRELAVHADWGGDYSRLGALVRPPLAPEKARKAVETMVRVGLLSRNLDGAYVQPLGAITAEDVPSVVTRKTRREFIHKALEALDGMLVDERHIAGVTVAMSRATYDQYVARIDEIRRGILEAALVDGKVDGVYQFNFQAFPVSQQALKGFSRPRDGGSV